MHDEWELLVITDGIEPGDEIDVENEDGDVEKMTFVRQNAKGVLLKDEDGEVAKFSSSTLDEIGGYRSIVGKSQDS